MANKIQMIKALRNMSPAGGEPSLIFLKKVCDEAFRLGETYPECLERFAIGVSRPKDNSYYEERIGMYEREVRTMEQTIAELNGEAAGLYGDIKAYQQLVADKDKTITDLRIELIDAVSRLSRCSSSKPKSSMGEDDDDDGFEFAHLEAEKEDLETENEKLANEVDHLRHELDYSDSRNYELAGELLNIKNALTEAQALSQENKQEETVWTLQEQVDDLRIQRDELVNEVEYFREKAEKDDALSVVNHCNVLLVLKGEKVVAFYRIVNGEFECVDLD